MPPVSELPTDRPPGRATRAPRPRPARRHPPRPLRVDVPRRRRAPCGAAGPPGGRAWVVRPGDDSSVLPGLGACAPRWWRGCPRSDDRAPGRGCAFPTTPGTPETGTTPSSGEKVVTIPLTTARIPLPRPLPDDDFAGVAGRREVVLDVNTLDAGTGYLDLGLSIVSPDENLLAYALDTSGDEVFTLRFRDLRTGSRPARRRRGRRLHRRLDVGLRTGFLYTVPDASWRHERIRRAPARHRPGRRRRRARRARPPVRGHRAAVPQRAGDRGAQREPRHHARRGTSTRPAPTWSRARSAAGGPAWTYRAEHVRAAGDQGASCSSPTTTRSSSGWCRAPCPAPAGQDHTTWREARPEDPARAARAGRRVRGVRRGDAAARRRPHAARCWPPTTWPGRASSSPAASPVASSGWPATPGTTRPRSRSTDESHTEPPVHAEVVVGRRLGDRHAPRRGPGPRPRVVRDARCAPSPRPTGPRCRPPSCGTATPRSTARRRAAVRLRRLRVSGSASGRSRCPRCSTAAWSSCTPTSGAAASAAAAGGSTAG